MPQHQRTRTPAKKKSFGSKRSPKQTGREGAHQRRDRTASGKSAGGKPAAKFQKPGKPAWSPVNQDKKKTATTARPTESKISRLFLFYKPFGVLSQFTDETGKRTLAEFNFPKDVYPVGRLDYDSEGLLLLTNDNVLKHRLLNPKYEHPRTYLAQVEREPEESALIALRRGVKIGDERTKPALVHVLHEEPKLPEREKPIRFRVNVPTAWIELTITEGKNRQVRRMTAAVGHPTLRLVRISIGEYSLGDLKPGESKLSER